MTNKKVRDINNGKNWDLISVLQSSIRNKRVLPLMLSLPALAQFSPAAVLWHVGMQHSAQVHAVIRISPDEHWHSMQQTVAITSHTTCHTTRTLIPSEQRSAHHHFVTWLKCLNVMLCNFFVKYIYAYWFWWPTFSMHFMHCNHVFYVFYIF